MEETIWTYPVRFVWNRLGNGLAEVGRVSMMYANMLVSMFRRLPSMRLIIDQMQTIGVGSLGLVIIVSVFTGAVAAVQAAYQFTNVVPMIELPDAAIDDYVKRNAEVVMRIAQAFAVTAIHANHAVLISVTAQQVSAATSIPFTVMPHGSDIEYAVKKDQRFLRLAAGVFTAAKRIFVHGQEMRARVNKVFSSAQDIDAKMTELHLGVNTSLFELTPRSLRRPDGRSGSATGGSRYR